MIEGAAGLARPVQHGAVISDCGRYRYWLGRVWEPGRPLVAFIMLNPSTADGTNDDPTIRKCIGFAKRWGYGRIAVVNLYAWRATDPKALALASVTADIEGRENHAYVMRACTDASKIVCAWGAHPARAQVRTMQGWLEDAGVTAWCIGTTKAGHPRHPLMAPYAQPLERFQW